MSKPKVVIDLEVIPAGWTLEDWNRVFQESGIAVVDTQHHRRDTGVKILDEDGNYEVVEFEDFQKELDKKTS